MRTDLLVWGAVALLLMAAEALVPGAFLVWLGLAAGAVFLLVLVVPSAPLLLQVGAFAVLAFVFVGVYRRFRGRDRQVAVDPALNARAERLVGTTTPLVQAIANGRGRVQIADALWDVSGPDLPAGTVVRVVGADGMVLRVRPDRGPGPTVGGVR